MKLNIKMSGSKSADGIVVLVNPEFIIGCC